MAAREAGYHAALVQLLSPELTTKSDLLLGVPAAACNDACVWPWAQTGGFRLTIHSEQFVVHQL